MNNKKYFENILRIKEIISQLDEGRLTPEEARKSFETGKKLLEECELMINCYSGTIEEMDFVSAGY
ncbi:Exodeoxyribonuclease 7 small subunit [uncultured archaeon]|nr:Exodeoxyribonuclease 7 small subunit [uncultured archaeon]